MADAASKQKFTFYTSNEYWHELISRIDRAGAGDRVALMTMDFDPREPVVHTLVKALYAAVRRGVAITLAVDAHTFLLDSRVQRLGPLWFRNDFKKLGKSFVEKYETLQALAGTPDVTYILMNRPVRPFSNPVAGRSHIKFSLINNHVFIGGCNLANTNTYDLMVGCEDEQLARRLHQMLVAIATAGNVRQALAGRDQTVTVDPDTTLLIDAGERNRSVIFDQALDLIDSAHEHVTITCQFFPNSITARHLVQAYRRGVQVTIVYADPRQHTSIAGWGQQVSIVRERLRVPKALFALRLPKDGPIPHAKLLATDVGTLVGSHNYVRAGVRLGTAEIALLSKDKNFHDDALAALSRELANVTL